MTCRFLDDVLLLDSVRFDAAEARALEAHAADCAECSPVLARLRAARAAQLSVRAPIPPDARAVVWAGLEAKRGDRRAPMIFGTRAMAALGAFATVAVAWLVFHRAPEPVSIEAPALTVQEIKPVENIVLIARGRVRPEPGAKWRASDDGIVTTIQVDEGTIDVELDPAATAEIVTLDARVRVIGGRAIVGRAPRGTDVRADQGTAVIWARGLSLPISIEQGQSVLVPVTEADKQAEKPKRPRERAPDPVQELKTAREVIETDAPRAAEIAERVLERRPTAELEAQALAVLADAERRSGQLRAAAGSYAKLRDHPRGRGYAEEAMLQRALLLERMHELDAALAELAKLETNHPRGVSAPERAALAAKIYLEKNDPRRAAKAILDVRFEGRSRALENRRAEVARALAPIDPALAKLLMASKTSSDH